VANAVLDGTDAVMLSAETAVGDYPVETIEAMARICLNAERENDDQSLGRRGISENFKRVDQTIAIAALFAASHFKIKAIVAMTQSGSTPLWMSRLNVGVPIFAMTPVQETLTKVTLFSGVHPIEFYSDAKNQTDELRNAEQALLERKLIKKGDMVVMTIGEAVGRTGHTNTLKIVCAGENTAN
jgi:pyruvate kinase